MDNCVRTAHCGSLQNPSRHKTKMSRRPDLSWDKRSAQEVEVDFDTYASKLSETARQKHNEACQQWQKANPEAVAAIKKRCRERHADTIAEYAVRYRHENQEKISARLRQYRIENAEAVAASKRRWREANADTIKQWAAQYRADNADHIKAVMGAYREDHREEQNEKSRLRMAALHAKRKEEGYVVPEETRQHRLEKGNEWRAANRDRVNAAATARYHKRKADGHVMTEAQLEAKRERQRRYKARKKASQSNPS